MAPPAGMVAPASDDAMAHGTAGAGAAPVRMNGAAADPSVRGPSSTATRRPLVHVRPRPHTAKASHSL